MLGGVASYYGESRIYRSATSVLIIPQRIPDRFVQPTVTAALNDVTSTSVLRAQEMTTAR
ncbi:MAG TPA: hypothetical protein VFO31_05145 [Vicinamibacterales bacterium]|nr:hypothetical protein [Vicinamibacterales bacterium]